MLNMCNAFYCWVCRWKMTGQLIHLEVGRDRRYIKLFLKDMSCVRSLNSLCKTCQRWTDRLVMGWTHFMRIFYLRIYMCVHVACCWAELTIMLTFLTCEYLIICLEDFELKIYSKWDINWKEGLIGKERCDGWITMMKRE